MTNQPIATRSDVRFVTTGAYQAGVCNIGPAEIRRRRMAGHVGLAGTLALLSLLVAVGAPPVARLLVVAPAAIAASGYIQARSRFCANYGWRGIFNVGDVGDAASVEDTAARAADQRRARQIGMQSLGTGLVAGIAAMLIPV